MKRWIHELLTARLKRLLLGNAAVEIETDALLDYAAQVARIEEQADRYEAEGKGHLAAILRERASLLSLDNPAAAGERIEQALGGPISDTARLALPGNGGAIEGPTAKPRRGRPPKQGNPAQEAPAEFPIVEVPGDDV